MGICTAPMVQVSKVQRSWGLLWSMGVGALDARRSRHPKHLRCSRHPKTPALQQASETSAPQARCTGMVFQKNVTAAQTAGGFQPPSPRRNFWSWTMPADYGPRHSNGVPKNILSESVDIVLIRYDDAVCLLPYDACRRRIARSMGPWALTKEMGDLYCTYRSPFSASPRHSPSSSVHCRALSCTVVI